MKTKPQVVQNEYRCTRPDMYGENTPGHTDTSARHGYYIDAPSYLDAHNQMKEKFPTDKRFDVVAWRVPSFRPYPAII